MLDEHGSFAVLDAFIEGRGNFIDTADVYGQGTSESWNSPAYMEARNLRANPSLVQKQPG